MRELDRADHRGPGSPGAGISKYFFKEGSWICDFLFVKISLLDSG